MAIRGVTKNIATTPVAQKNMDPKEAYIPYNIDLRNGRLTDADNWAKRPGFGEWRDLGTGQKTDLLIPEDDGYAITEDGRIFKINSISQTELSGVQLNGEYRPTYTNRKGKYIICDGGDPIKIYNGVTSLLGGTPPNARFIATIGSYNLLAGQTKTSLSTDPLQEVRFSDPINEEDYVGPLAGSFYIKTNGSVIKNIKDLNEKLYVFTDFGIEVWINIDSDTKTFVNQQAAFINIGCISDYSVVKVISNNTIYWLGHDRRFYELREGGARIISNNIEKYLFGLLNHSSIYGFDYEKESKVKWFAPLDGKCFVYDYKNKVMYEENTWDHGQWERMPVNSYMELNGKQYFGDYDPTGKIFEWSRSFLDDNGKPIRNYRLLSLRPSSKGNNTRLNRIGFSFTRGDESFIIPPVFFWRFKTDNGNWSDYRSITLRQSDFGKMYFEDFPGAVGLEWEIEVVHTDNSDFILKNIDATFQEMGR